MMDKKLIAFLLIFFIFLLAFINFIIINENKNMEKIRAEYPDLKEEAYSFRKDNLKVWAVRLVLSFLIPILFLITKLSQRISVGVGEGRGLFLSGLLYGAIFFGIIFIINLPLNFYSSYYLSHKYGLSDQTLLRWIELNIKGFLVGDFITALFLWFPYLLLFRSPKYMVDSVGASEYSCYNLYSIYITLSNFSNF